MAPRIEQLAAFENRAAELESMMSTLATDAQARRWRERTAGLLRDMEAADVSLDAATDLGKTLALDDSGGANQNTWVPGENGILTPPAAHRDAVQRLARDLQRYIQELAVGEIDASSNDAAPPEYVDFVRQYLEVLSEDAGR